MAEERILAAWYLNYEDCRQKRNEQTKAFGADELHEAVDYANRQDFYKVGRAYREVRDGSTPMVGGESRNTTALRPRSESGHCRRGGRLAKGESES